MNKEEFIDLNMKLSKEDVIYNYYETEEKLIEKLGIEHELYELKEQCKKQKEVINNAIEYIKEKQKIQYKFALSHIECDDLLEILENKEVSE